MHLERDYPEKPITNAFNCAQAPVLQPTPLPRISKDRVSAAEERVRSFALAGLPQVMTIGGYTPVGPSVSNETVYANELLGEGFIPFRALAMRNSWQNRAPQSPEFFAAYFAQWLPTVRAVLELPSSDPVSKAVCNLAVKLGIPVVHSVKELTNEFGRRDLGLGIDFLAIATALRGITNPSPSRPWDGGAVERLQEIGERSLALGLPRIYVAGPYSSDENRGTLAAFQYASKIAAHTCPLVPHYTHDWDTGVSLPYEAWLCLDACILPHVASGVRLKGRSSGADGEVAVLQELERPVYDADEYPRMVASRRASHELFKVFSAP